jgi:hypothetical protein
MSEFLHLLESTEPPMGAMSAAAAVLSILLSFGLARYLIFVYKRTKRGFSYNPQFTNALAIIAVTATFIMAVVGNSVARAFSLAGALSIIRFRNAMKETEDIVAIFLAMSIGIACGSGFYMLGIIATLLIGVLWLVQAGAFGRTLRPRAAVVAVETSDSVDLQTDVAERLAAFSSEVMPLGVASLQPVSPGLRYHYKVALKPKVEGAAVVAELNKRYAGAALTWLDEE